MVFHAKCDLCHYAARRRRRLHLVINGKQTNKHCQSLNENNFLLKFPINGELL